MAIEIERKYLLKNDLWKKETTSSYYLKQGYLNSNENRTVRVRIQNEKGILTVKSKNQGSKRKEFEYEIPLQDAEELILLCEQPIREKTRHLAIIESHTWEIDIFEGKK